MKGASKEYLESLRPKQVTASESVRFSLSRLYADEVNYIGDEVVEGLTFEELIGALLLARDELRKG